MPLSCCVDATDISWSSRIKQQATSDTHVAQVAISTVEEQQLAALEVRLGGTEVQRRAELFRLRIDVGVRLQQDGGALDATAEAREVQRRAVELVAHFRRLADRDEKLDELGMILRGGQVHGAAFVAVGDRQVSLKQVGEVSGTSEAAASDEEIGRAHV